MSDAESQQTNWRNREHYLKAAVLGGAVSTVLSLTPVINWLNLFFFCLIMFGGGISVYWVQKKTGTVDSVEGALLGGLAGLMVGVFYAVLGFCGVSVASAVLIPDMRSSEVDEFITIMVLFMTAMCGFGFTVYPMMSALGGLIATLIWPPNGGEAAPSKPKELTPEEAAKRKTMIRIVLGSLSGCLVLVCVFCGFAGYLAYLEERDPQDTAGDAEVVSSPLAVGERMVIEIEPTDSGTVRYAVWLVAESELPSAIYDLDGRIGCRANMGYGSRPPYMRNIYTYRGPDEGEPEWLFLDDQTAYGGDPVTCHVRINALPEGVSNARIVVTKVSRPSDWF